jgi:hypothetical protein
MSAGDIDNVSFADQKWAEFRAHNPRLMSILGMGFNINQQYDIPFLGGISGDSRTVYLDRHFNRNWNGRDVGQFVAVHETTEWYCMVHLGMDYTKGHRWANTAEDHAVWMLGLDDKAYNRHLDKFVPKIEAEKIQHTPRDLFMGPYNDDPKLAALIRSAFT